MTHDMGRLDPERVEDARDVRHQLAKRVSLDRLRPVAASTPAQIGNDRAAKPRRRQHRNLQPPYLPRVRETVQQQHRPSFTNVLNMEAKPVGGDVHRRDPT